MENLLNPTPQDIKTRNELWAKALDENSQKARKRMRNDIGGRCCLAVAEDVAIQCGVKIDDNDRDLHFPAPDVGRFFGWRDGDNPFLKTPSGDECLASLLNDGCESFGVVELTHRQIAECVRNTFVHTEE